MEHPIVKFIKKNMEDSEHLGDMVFKCTSEYDSKVMLHVDLNGQIILTVEEADKWRSTRVWILRRN